MTSPTKYVKGDWKAVCDSCGQRFLASELRKRWDGLMVCSKDYEPRHPQDFVKGRTEEQSVPWSRSESETYSYVAIDYDRTLIDVLGLRETISKVVGKVISDSLSFNEAVVVLRILNQAASDTMSVSESVSKTISKVLSDTLTITESLSITSRPAFSDSMTIGEVVSLYFSFVRNLSDSMSISEQVVTSILTENLNSLNSRSMNFSSLG